MNREWEKAPWFSSYEHNNYGVIFYGLMRVYQPEKVVELGNKAGYSAYHMARGLKANGKGSIDCYDLWEKYEYNSVPKATAEANLKKYGDIVNLKLSDALGVENKYKSVDILHIDLGNDGELLDNLVPKWLPKVQQLIIIEGGSAERDKVEWMVKYKKQSIADWLKEFCPKNNLQRLTIKPFPSLTMIQKK